MIIAIIIMIISIRNEIVFVILPLKMYTYFEPERILKKNNI